LALEHGGCDSFTRGGGIYGFPERWIPASSAAAVRPFGVVSIDELELSSNQNPRAPLLFSETLRI
jgi:hypothetical protein